MGLISRGRIWTGLLYILLRSRRCFCEENLSKKKKRVVSVVVRKA
jgi:hypothetical protein